MNNWFECKVQYVKIDESGKEKKVKEPYLVDALSFTEAEARITEKLTEYITGDFLVTNMSKSKIAELFEYEDGDKWYKCKISYVSVNEESGKEKKVSCFMYLAANDVREAYDRLEENLSEMVVPVEILSITETAIMDVFPYNPSESVNKEGNEKPDYVEFEPEESFQ